jgi:hypothetical protein
MSPDKDPKLSTADIARASDEVRGVHEERLVDRETNPTTVRPQEQEYVVPRPDRIEAATERDRPRPAADTALAANTPLFGEKDAGELRRRWSDIQAAFVDEPRKAVENADSLVADVMKRLAEGFAHDRNDLERQWNRGDKITTEDLRVTLQRYRSFFVRLLEV